MIKNMYKMKIISLLISLFSIIKTKALECVSVVYQKCMARPKILDVNKDVGEVLFYLYNVQVNKCSGSCNTLDNPMTKLCVANVIKRVNMQVYNFLMRLNETRNVLWHENCKCVCKINSSVCNNKQIWNDDTCRCNCNEDFTDIISCDKGYMWNPSTCKCQCDTRCKQGQYLDHKNWVCKNKLIGRVIEECTSVIKKQITEMLSLTTKESIILFDMTFYTQVDGVAMGSPLGPSLANAFLCHHETKWLNDCPEKFKPVFYKRYVDDIFVLFKRPEHVKPFVDYMNSKHKNINFSFETEKDCQMPFLDVNVFRENGKFVTNVYRKETFTGVYTNFSSFIPLEHKFGLVYTLLHRCFCFVSDMSKFHFEIEKLKEILLSNGYSNNFFDKCISKFMNTLYIKKPVMLTVPKKQLYLVLPFMGKMSALVKSGLARSLHKRLPFCKVKIIFKTSNRLKNYFSFKDVVPEPLRSCQIYNFTCGSCNASYIGKTFRHMKVRVSEHQGVSPRTGKHLKGTLSTSVRDHMLDCNHIVAWDDFKVLGRESNHWLLEIKESLFIKRDRPSLNKNIYSQELFLF